jgi:hypothetical protein
MKKLIAALAIAAATVLPAGATPRQLEVINYDEMMVLVPSLEHVGYSRITTVEACAEWNNITDWTDLITDEDLLNMEACLWEMT